MNDNLISQLCYKYCGSIPIDITRCTEGIGNYVYICSFPNTKCVVRCSCEPNAYSDTIHWLEKLYALGVPVPKILDHGQFHNFQYLILSYIEGSDLGILYPQLTDVDKRTIAEEIVCIQSKVAALDVGNVEPDWSWHSYIQYMLDRARERISLNGFFDPKKVDSLLPLMNELSSYFSSVKPIAYLDDISSKNLIIHNGHISGIIDVDWMGIGDKLTYVALTNIALLNLDYDTAYVRYILEAMQPSDLAKKAFLFYSLMYCVDFMGERGMVFVGKKVDVNQQIIFRLNSIYDHLWCQWHSSDPISNRR